MKTAFFKPSQRMLSGTVVARLAVLFGLVCLVATLVMLAS